MAIVGRWLSAVPASERRPSSSPSRARAAALPDAAGLPAAAAGSGGCSASGVGCASAAGSASDCAPHRRWARRPARGRSGAGSATSSRSARSRTLAPTRRRRRGLGFGGRGLGGLGLGPARRRCRGAGGEQAEGVGEFADQGRGHRVAVDLAGLVAAGQRVHAGDHGQPDLHRRIDPGPQDQVGQAVGHPLLLGPLIAGNLAGLGVGLQRPQAGPGDRQRQQRGQHGHAVLAGLQPHTALADRPGQPPGRGGGVGAQHRPPGGLPQRGDGLALGAGQQPGLHLGADLVLDRADDLGQRPRTEPADAAGLQRVQGGRQPLIEGDRVGQQPGRGPRRQPEGDHHLIDGPLAHRGQRRRAGRPRRRGGGTDLLIGAVQQRRRPLPGERRQLPGLHPGLPALLALRGDRRRQMPGAGLQQPAEPGQPRKPLLLLLLLLLLGRGVVDGSRVLGGRPGIGFGQQRRIGRSVQRNGVQDVRHPRRRHQPAGQHGLDQRHPRRVRQPIDHVFDCIHISAR